MNAADRRKYQREYSQINGKFNRKWQPKIFKAVNELVSSLIEDIKANGVQAATYNLTITAINDKLYKPVESLYKDVGLFHAKRNYRFIRSEINQKGFSFRNEQWVNMIIQYLRDNLLQYAVIKPTETLRNQLLKLIEQGVSDGLGEYEIIKLIQDSGFANNQTQRIVRTEVNRAANTGNYLSAQSFEYEMVKEWIAHRDARTRGRKPKDKFDHYHMDGNTVGLEEDFKDPKSGENIAYPSAPGASAGMVINCRCSMATVPKRDENDRLIRKPNRNILTGVPIG